MLKRLVVRVATLSGALPVWVFASENCHLSNYVIDNDIDRVSKFLIIHAAAEFVNPGIKPGSE